MNEEPIATALAVEMVPGITLRDWFAGQALIGRITGLSTVIGAALVAGKQFELSASFDGAARDSYRYADAMLKARGE